VKLTLLLCYTKAYWSDSQAAGADAVIAEHVAVSPLRHGQQSSCSRFKPAAAAAAQQVTV
jgi:hypothetical protein